MGGGTGTGDDSILEEIDFYLVRECRSKIRLKVAKELKLKDLINSEKERLSVIERLLKDFGPSLIKKQKKQNYLVELNIQMEGLPYTKNNMINEGSISLMDQYDLKVIEVIDELKEEVDSWPD